MAETPVSEASTPVLVKDVAVGVYHLFKLDLAQAKAEMTAGAKRAAKGVVLVALGAAAALYGVCALLATAIILLALIMPVWAAAVIVTVVVLAAATVTALIGLRIVDTVDLRPAHALETLKEDGEWLKGQLS